MARIIKRVVSICLSVLMVVSLAIPQAGALSYSGSASYKSGKYYQNLINVELTGNQRLDIVNVAKSQVGYQEGGSSSQLSGTVKGSGNYTEYGRWYGMQDMWCAMFVSWCANAAGISTSIVPSHSYTPTGLNWFRNRGQAYTRATVANGGYTPQAGDIIYFKSSRNSNITNHIGIVTGYSNGRVYTIEGNTSSATISTNGGAVCEKSYSISNTYIVYICRPAYKDTSVSSSSSSSSSGTTEWLTGAARGIVFDAVYYANQYPEIRSLYGTDETKLFDHFYNYGIKEGRRASPIFDIKYYVENNSDVQEAYGTDYVGAMKHFVSAGINEARVTAEPIDFGASFQARIGYPAAGLNFSLSDTNVITYTPSDKPAQVWTFERHPCGAYRIINSKNGYSLAVDGYTSESNVGIAEYKDSRRQLWYIYERSDGRYVFRSMAASGCVIDVYAGCGDPMTNVWSYTYNGSNAQQFSIDKLSGLSDLTPADLGTDFYGKINASEGMNLSLMDTNVILYGDSNASAQVWKFVRQEDGSYEIVNQKTGMLLDVYWASGSSGTNVQIFQDHDNIAQRWFIYESADQYVFRPACSNTCVMEVTGNSTQALANVRTYVYNGSDAQKFGIERVDDASVLYPPTDVGTDFCAKITAASGKNLSVTGTNVAIDTNSSALAQVWKFLRQEDGSYEIVNQQTDLLLDVYWATDASGTNVQVFQDHDNIAQRWFISEVEGRYVFRPACSGTRVLDVTGGSDADQTNVQIYDFIHTNSQLFEINVVADYSILDTAVDIGTEFFAKINASDGMNLSLSDTNVILYSDSTAPAQVWKFMRQTDGSYEIINQKTGLLLDVYWATDASGTNVQIFQDHDNIAQRWFIHCSGDQYVLRPACSGSRVLDVEGNGTADMTNVQIYDFNDTDSQRFRIEKIGGYLDLGTPADLGTDFYAKINASEGMNLSLSDSNVIIYGDSSAAAQVWKFVRQTNGSYEIINQKNGLVLDVYAAADASGTNVQIYADNDSDAQRWYIYQTGDQYVLRSACSYSRVLDVNGNSTAALTNVQIYTYNASDAQKFGIVVQEDYVPGAGVNMEVLRKLMYAVETGGQVYGQADYADFTEAYTNTSEEHAITIGAGQWYGPEAKTLLNRIRQADPATFSALDTAGIAADLDSANWSTYQLSKSSAKAKCIQSIISTEIGMKCQDQLMDEQLAGYMQEAADLGVTDVLAQMMCANIRHLGGLSAVKRVLAKTEQPYTIHTIYEAMQTDTGNQVGTFRSRNLMVYNTLLEYFG